MKNNILIVAIIVAVAAAGLGFAGGMKYQEAKTVSPAVQNQGRFGVRRNSPNNNMAVRGKVVSSDDTSATVQLADGSTKIVLVDGKTVFSRLTTVKRTDVKDGETIAVFGTTNSDGSVTAQTVQLNPGTFGMGADGPRQPAQ